MKKSIDKPIHEMLNDMMVDLLCEGIKNCMITENEFSEVLERLKARNKELSKHYYEFIEAYSPYVGLDTDDYDDGEEDLMNN